MMKLVFLIGFLAAFIHQIANAYTYSPAPNGGGWEYVTSSSDGKYVYAADVNGMYGVLSSSDYGYHWTSPGNGLMGIYYQVVTSGDGKYVIGIHNSNADLSKDYGASYKGGVTSVHSAAISRSGQYMLCPVYNYDTPKAIKVSTNYGTTFQEVAGTELLQQTFSGMSGSGQYMIAGNYSTVLFSSNYGSSFTQVKNLPTNYYWGPVDANYDGRYILIGSTQVAYYSSDYGKSFGPSTFPKGHTAFSDSGQYIVVATANIGIQISSDYGATWTMTSAPAKNWGDVTISADGRRIVVVEYRGSIYMSGDYGVTWGLYPPTSAEGK